MYYELYKSHNIYQKRFNFENPAIMLYYYLFLHIISAILICIYAKLLIAYNILEHNRYLYNYSTIYLHHI